MYILYKILEEGSQKLLSVQGEYEPYYKIY